jgi:L-ectoine synthase
MIIKKLDSVIDSDRDIDWGNGRSRRLLLKSDGFPYSITDTIINAGTESRMQYLNHVEACYCIEGSGEVESGGQVHKLEPGTLYAPENDKHILRAFTTLRLICVFTPPLSGTEHHSLSADAFSTYES